MPEKCGGHGTQNICQESGKVANEYCPADKVQTQSYGGTVPKEKLGLWKAINSSSKTGNEKIEETCTIHKKTEEKPQNTENRIQKQTNTTNSTNTTTNTTNGKYNRNKQHNNRTTNTTTGTTNKQHKNTTQYKLK